MYNDSANTSNELLAKVIFRSTLGMIYIGINCLILYYIYQLEKKKCNCAINWKHKFIKYVAPILIGSSILLFIYKVIMNSLEKTGQDCTIGCIIFNILSGIIALIALIYITILLVYYFEIRKSNCECAKECTHYLMVYPIISIVLAILSGITGVIYINTSPKKF